MMQVGLEKEKDEKYFITIRITQISKSILTKTIFRYWGGDFAFILTDQ